MREWQVGDPTGTGEDLGVPDIPCMGYLRERNDNHGGNNGFGLSDVKLSFDDSMRVARTFKSRGDYANAIRHYNNALEYKYHDEEAMSEKAECFEKLGDKIQASDVYYDLAFTLERKENEKAVKYYKRCYVLNPNNEKVLWDLPQLLKDMGRYKEAIFYFEKNIKAKAFCNDACAWHIAHCYCGLKDYKNELKWIDKCLHNHFCLQDVYIKFMCLKNLNRLSDGIMFYEDSVRRFLNNKKRPCDGDALKVLEKLIKIRLKQEYVEKRDNILKSHNMSYYRLDALAQTCCSCRNKDLIEFMSTYCDDDFKIFVEEYCKITGESKSEFKSWYLELNSDDLMFIDNYFSHPTHDKYQCVLSQYRWWAGLFEYLSKDL